MAHAKMLLIGTEVIVEYARQVISLVDVAELVLLRLLTFGFFISAVKRVIRHL
jgi:hypothetical protein